MKTSFITCFLAFLMLLSSYGQKSSMTLSFSAVDNTTYTSFEGITIKNLTQGGEIVKYWPDTVLILDYLGVDEMMAAPECLTVFQNYPNPASGITNVRLYIPRKGKVKILVSDFYGYNQKSLELFLDKGYHVFQLTPGKQEAYIFSVIWHENISSIKIMNNIAKGFDVCSLEYAGTFDLKPALKSKEETLTFPFAPGDQLMFTAFKQGVQTAIIDVPMSNHHYIFQFASNIPCPGTPDITFDGQLYNTVQIFGQCWLKENLNVGNKISISQNMTDNGILEKQCYDDVDSNCAIYGGLYQWDEMMQYVTIEGAQGICPPGWHVPTNQDWKVLEGSVDSQYRIGNPEWDNSGVRGLDAGANLKSASGWVNNGNGTDLFGFSGLAGGRCAYGSCGFKRAIAYYWTSRPGSTGLAWHRDLTYSSDGVTTDYDYSDKPAYSVRCLKD